MENIMINWWAVLAAAVVNMVVGSIWYGPLFGKLWQGLMGFTPESMKNMKLSAPQAMAMGFVTALVMAYVLAHFVVIAGAVDATHAFELAFWIWLGFMLPLCAGSYIWEGKPAKLFVLNAAEALVALFLMALVLVMWQ